MCLCGGLRILWDCLTYALGGRNLFGAWEAPVFPTTSRSTTETSEAALEGDLAATMRCVGRKKESNHFSKLHDHLQARILVH